MSALESQFAHLGASISSALQQHAEQLADGRARNVDQQTQLGAFQISVSAVRTEVLSRIDACEVAVLRKLEEMQRELRAQMHAIAMALGTNGSGGDHG